MSQHEGGETTSAHWKNIRSPRNPYTSVWDVTTWTQKINISSPKQQMDSTWMHMRKHESCRNMKTENKHPQVRGEVQFFWRLALYPVVLVVCWTPGTINRYACVYVEIQTCIYRCVHVYANIRGWDRIQLFLLSAGLQALVTGTHVYM